MSERVEVRRIAIGAGALISIYAVLLFLVRPVPDAVVSLLGGPTGVDRVGGVRVRYRPPPGLEPAARSRLFDGARRDGDALLLELPGVAEDRVPELRELLASGGLAIREVLETPYADDIARLVPEQVQRMWRGTQAPRSGVIVDVDVWSVGGPRRYVRYLAAPSRGELERAIEAARARGWHAAPGTAIGFEQVAPRGGEPGPAYWRTYELGAEIIVDGAMIARATPSTDPYTDQPIVIVDLTAAGARRFCDATARLVGHKLATAVGDHVLSAPVLMSSICGGGITITTGTGDRGAKAAGAILLAAVLSGPSLPPGGTVESARWSAPMDAAAEEWIGRLGLGLGAGALGGLLAALVIRLARPRWRRAPERASGPFPYRRLAITLLAPVAVYLAGKLPLPGLLHTAEIERLMATTRVGVPGVFALGVMPILSAFVIVELVALAVPDLRWRRHDPRGRIALGQVTAALAVATAVVQGYVMAIQLEELSRSVEIVAAPGLGFRVTTAVTLAAGTLLFGALAGVIREHGLGNGYGAVVVAGWIVESPERLLGAGRGALPSGSSLALGIAALAVIAAFTAAVLRWRVDEPSEERAPALRVPSSGIMPLGEAGGLVTLTGLLVGMGLGAALGEAVPWRGELPRDLWLALGLVAVLVPVWADLLARPSLVAATARRAGLPAPSWGAWRRAALASGALLLAVHAAAALAGAADAGAAVLAAPAYAMIGTAVILDIVDDARAHRRRLAPAGVLHQIQRAGVIERVLADAGIPCQLHASHLRTLLAFFGPFAPVIVLVPESLAADARRVLAGVEAPPGPGAPATSAPSSSPESPEPSSPPESPEPSSLPSSPPRA